MRRPERQRKEYRTWQQCENRCIAAGSRLSYTLQDGQKGNPGYKAEDTKLERLVALKLLPAHFLDDGDIRKRFEREAKSAGGAVSC